MTAPHASGKLESRVPLVSVVVEGYNEMALATSVTEVLDGLARQDYPLNRIEVIMVGTAESQLRRWKGINAELSPFHRLLTIDAEGALYYDLKNKGAAQASGEIIAFIDSDVYPEPGWLSAIVRAIQSGADVTAGISALRSQRGGRTPRAVLDVCASICFGHVVGEDHEKAPDVRALVAHNLALRSEVFHAHPFDTRLGRNCAIALLYQALRRSDARLRLVPEQRVAHSFSLRWFFYPFRVRVGWEEYEIRRRSAESPHRWMMRAGPLEPLLTMIWYMGLEVPRWFRTSRYLGLAPARRWALFPLLLLLATAAHATEMVGMYGAMLRPQKSMRWAEVQ